MESPLAAIETNRDIEQESPRIATVDKDRDQVVRKLVAEVAELRSEGLICFRFASICGIK